MWGGDADGATIACGALSAMREKKFIGRRMIHRGKLDDAAVHVCDRDTVVGAAFDKCLCSADRIGDPDVICIGKMLMLFLGLERMRRMCRGNDRRDSALDRNIFFGDIFFPNPNIGNVSRAHHQPLPRDHNKLHYFFVGCVHSTPVERKNGIATVLYFSAPS